MRRLLLQSSAVVTVGAAAITIYDRGRPTRTDIPGHSPPPTSHAATKLAPSTSNAMSPGVLQVPELEPKPEPKATEGGGDALDTMKAGVAGHASQLAGLARGGSALAGIPSFETTYAVPMHCQSCVRGIESAVKTLQGIESALADLDSGLLHVRGTAAPSAIVAALQENGRDAILRGSGASNSAAVCILEIDGETSKGTSPVRGLARLVQVNKTHTLIDLTLSGLKPGRYEARIRATGDISQGVASLGGVWERLNAKTGNLVGDLGTVEVDDKGRGAAYIAQEMSVWEIIGRGMSIVREGAEVRAGEGVCGVLARSAGVWDNEKIVCSCSGKTVWDERKDQRSRGIL